MNPAPSTTISDVNAFESSILSLSQLFNSAHLEANWKTFASNETATSFSLRTFSSVQIAGAQVECILWWFCLLFSFAFADSLRQQSWREAKFCKLADFAGTELTLLSHLRLNINYYVSLHLHKIIEYLCITSGCRRGECDERQWNALIHILVLSPLSLAIKRRTANLLRAEVKSKQKATPAMAKNPPLEMSF